MFFFAASNDDFQDFISSNKQAAASVHSDKKNENKILTDSTT